MEEIIIKQIKPLYTKILLTKDMYTDAAYHAGTHILDTNKIKQGVKELQTVLAVGTSVRDIKPGDIVCINPTRYAVKKYTKNDTKELMEEYSNGVIGYAFPEIEIDGKSCLYLDERDVDFVVTKFTTLEN